MSQISLVELLEAGAHFGHRKDKWHPAAKSYIYTTRNGVHVINLEKTARALEEAENYLENQAAAGKVIALVCTKRQGKDIVRTVAEEASIPYVTERWIGGTFTNFDHIRKLSEKLKNLEEDMTASKFQHYTKKERLSIEREIERLRKIVGGMQHLTQLPDVLFLVDIKKNGSALKEASALRIPVVAITDTNVDHRQVNYAIPANDDATKAIELITRRIGEAIKRGMARKQVATPAPVVEAAQDTPTPIVTA
jgi:small subunit ribosomal protein S2